MNIAEEIDRVYARAWMMFEQAVLDGDDRLARDLLREIRLTLGLVLSFAGKIADGGLRRLIDQTAAGHQAKADEAWELLEAKLIALGEKRAARLARYEAQDFEDFRPVYLRGEQQRQRKEPS
jgi:hypothetical protein